MYLNNIISVWTSDVTSADTNRYYEYVRPRDK